LEQSQCDEPSKKTYRWKRIHTTPALGFDRSRVQAKQLDWELLKLWAQTAELCLKYLDESGCCCESATIRHKLNVAHFCQG
jgi:hypothetical protein